MSDLIWWTLFAILLLVLVVLTCKLCYRVVSDVWCTTPEVSEDAQDLEDLTRYKRDFRTIVKDVQVKDESDRLMMTKEFHFKNEQNGTTPTLTTFGGKEKDIEQMHAIVEEDENKSNGTNEVKIEEEKEERKSNGTNEEKVDDEKMQTVELPNAKINQQEKIQIDEKEKDRVDGQETENFDEKEKDRVDGQEIEHFTDEEKKLLEQILKIQNATDTFAKQIPFCLGGKNHLTYFDINEKFLMNLMGLSSIDCKDNQKLKRRKQMVSMYIQECQNELKKRADTDFV